MSTSAPIDLDALVAQVLAPRRAQLAAAREAVAGLTDPLEAWEALATRELVPFEWITDGARATAGEARITCPECKGAVETGQHTPACTWYARPMTLDAAVALAADPEGIVTAETLAREFVTRLAPWNYAMPARFVWRVVRRFGLLYPDRPAKQLLQSVKSPAAQATARAFERTLRHARPLAEVNYTAVNAVVADVRRALGWRHQLGRNAQRPNPFEPLVAVWSTGYALEAITPRALVMIAPAPPP